MTILRSLVRFGYAPFMMIGLNVAAYALVSSGRSYGWLALLLGTAFAAAWLAEHVAPWYEEWKEPRQDDLTNFWHIAIYEQSNVNGVLLIPLIAWLSPFDGFWPHQLPLWAQMLGALVFVDFMLMFLHYLSHRLPFLWRLHAVHHGVERLYGLNGLVRHPLHQALDLIVATGPLAFLGMPVDVAVLLGFAVSVQLILQHSNVACVLGPFENVFSIGRLHHLHHVNWGAEGDCNFGLFLTLWDRLLGTFNPEPPRPIKPSDLGVDEVPNFPKSFLEQMIFPFVYEPGNGTPKRYASPDSKRDREMDRLQPAD